MKFPTQNSNHQTPQKSSNVELIFTGIVFLLIGSLYFLIWYFDLKWKESYSWKFSLLPPISIVLNSFRNLLHGEGGYVINGFGLLSFLSFFSLSARIGSFLNFLLTKSKNKFFTVQNVLLGLAFICVFYTMIGAFGMIHSSFAWIFFWLGLFFLIADAIALAKKFHSSIAELKAAISIYYIFIILWAGLWSCTAILIPTFHNFLQNQLGLPYYYLNEHNLSPNPYEIISYFPQNCEILILHFALLDTWVGINLLLWGIWALTLILIFEFVKELSDASSAIVAACWFAVIPVVYWMLSHGKNDIMVVLYFLAGTLVLFKFRKMKEEKKFDGIRNPALFVAGIFMGTALGTKYTALLFFPPLLCYLFSVVELKNLRSCFAEIALFAAGILIPSAFWYGRNLWLTGNPFYPLFISVIKTKMVMPWHHVAITPPLVQLGFLYALKQLFILLAGFVPNLNGIEIQSGRIPFQWGVTMPLVLLNLTALKFFSKDKIWLTVTALFGFIGMLFSDPNIRYYPTTVALFCIVTTISAHALSRKFHKWILHFMGLLIIVSIFTPTTSRQFRSRVLGSFTLLLSGIDPMTAKTYSPEYYPVDPQELLIMGKFINQTLPGDARILIVGDERSPLIQRRHIFQTDQHREIIDDWWDESKSLQGLQKKFEEEGVTHILLNSNYFSQEVQYTGLRSIAPDLHKRALPDVTELIKNHCAVIGARANGALLLLSVKKD